MTLNTIALELVPPNLERGHEQALEDAHKVVRCAAEAGLEHRIRHVMIPGMIEEDSDRPIEMKPKMDVLDFWSIIRPELAGMNGDLLALQHAEALGAVAVVADPERHPAILSCRADGGRARPTPSPPACRWWRG